MEQNSAIQPFAPWKHPFSYNAEGQVIQDAQKQRVVDIRGWGYLTGRGSEALGLESDEATKIQDQVGKNIAAAMNQLIEQNQAVAQSCTGFLMASHVAQQAIGMLQRALRNGMHGSRPEVEALLPRLVHQMREIRLISDEQIVGAADAEQLLSVMKFILHECDWEVGSGGDARIGKTLRAAIKEYEDKYPAPTP